ncbi:acyl-CoA dehydrogenase family protein [Streptomyces sp. NPDC006309]|uniref:acyl-CoA dehydrogenase family protein n=1 Tax=Streptomyces sp. NPDC006309 TaxID=3156749 RepID=UPI0033B6FE0A
MAGPWAESAFPEELVGRFRESGLAGPAYEGYGDHGPAAGRLLTGMMAPEMSRVDASVTTFFSASTTDWPSTPSIWAATGPSVTTGCRARTTARRDGDTWVLNGAKRWIGNATSADHVVVWARDVADDQVKRFVVDRQQFGRPLAGFQMVQDLLVKSPGNITSSWGMLLQLVGRAITGESAFVRPGALTELRLPSAER